MNLRNSTKFLVTGSLLLLLATFSFVHALTSDELQTLIDQKKQEKAQLDAQNKVLTDQINSTESQAQSLSSTIKIMDETAKKLNNDIKSTQTSITETQYEIEQLSLKIGDAQSRMQVSGQAVAKSLQALSESDKISIFEYLLSGQNIADAWNEVETLSSFNNSLKDHIDSLGQAKTEFTTQKDQTTAKRDELQSLQQQLVAQQKAVLENQVEKTKILVSTKNQEVAFQKQLQANIARGKEIEQEQFNFESQLQIAIDPSKLPAERPNVLSWPIAPPITITQKFGATVDSRRLYVSGTHNGVDFHAAIGTPVHAVLAGVVQAMGNTDLEPGCYSYGRWILIQHYNGLTSIYAHLSANAVSVGQVVSTGDIIGYSGYTGYVYPFGPRGAHLHLGLFATQGVRVQQYTSSKFCKNVSIPIAPIDGYLDPLAYLPSY